MALPIPAKFALRDGMLRPQTTGYPLDIPGRKPFVNLKRTPPDHWLNLPRRKCDMCGKSYKPSMPFRQGQKFGFCSRKCKDQFHTRGAGYTKARDQISKEIARQMRIYMKCDECHARPRRTPCARCAATGRILTEYGQDLKLFIEQTTEAYIEKQYLAQQEQAAVQTINAKRRKGA